MVPLFGALPGGPEMLIIMIVMLLLFFGPVVAIVYLLLRRSSGSAEDDQVAEMQAQIDELEAQIANEAAADEPDSADSGTGEDAGAGVRSVEDEAAGGDDRTVDGEPSDPENSQ